MFGIPKMFTEYSKNIRHKTVIYIVKFNRTTVLTDSNLVY